MIYSEVQFVQITLQLSTNLKLLIIIFICNWYSMYYCCQLLQTQLRIDAFYSFNQRFAKVRSARIQKALRGTTGRLSKEMVDIHSQDGGPPAKKQKQKKNTMSTGKKSAEGIETELVEEGEELNAVEGSGRGTSHNLVHGSYLNGA